MSRQIVVTATWDPEAGVHVATSEDVPGLVAEAATAEEMQRKLQSLIPGLLELNADLLPRDDGTEEVSVLVRAEHLSTLRPHA